MGGPPLLFQGNVGPEVGELRHSGDVRIAGNLSTGGRVRAGGDLHITGNVTSATATATGNLTVEGMVSGTATVLDAIGRITVLQASDAQILAGRDITILTAAERCRLRAGEEIQLRGMPGLLRGGVATAGRRVIARRIEAGGSALARIEIGGRVFDEDLEEMEERLAFVRKQTVQAKLTSGNSPETCRRALPGLRAYRKLARTLDHRVRQIRAGSRGEPPMLIVTGDAPVFTILHLGPEGAAIATPPIGPFELGLTAEVKNSSSPREVTCEQ